MSRTGNYLAGLTLALAALSSCHVPQPVASDDQMNLIREAYPGMMAKCLRQIRYGGVQAMPIETDKCFKMSPQRQWRGIWARGFEFSRFCPAPAKSCDYEAPGPKIWLTPNATVSILPDPQPSSRNEIRLFSVKFLGRKTRDTGHFGHMGEAEHEIIVDHVISVSEIQQQKPH